jgi:hypothetical protein
MSLAPRPKAPGATTTHRAVRPCDAMQCSAMQCNRAVQGRAAPREQKHALTYAHTALPALPNR